MSSLQFYWAVTAPGILLAIQTPVWIWLFVTRNKHASTSHDHEQLALNLPSR
jgi:hypothetical protein